MKILSWNCRGLGRHWTISYLRETWHKHKPDFLFLSETKQDFEFVQRFQSHFGYDSLATVDPNGRSGGLAIFFIIMGTTHADISVRWMPSKPHDDRTIGWPDRFLDE